MGCCWSCLDRDEQPASETELPSLEQQQAQQKSLSISRAMSAPSIDVIRGDEVCFMKLNMYRE
jgi:hypothetical protein